MRLLVAEDEKDMNRLITRALERKAMGWIPALTGRKPWIIWKARSTTGLFWIL